MSETKHTPGPWKYSAENGDFFRRYTDFSIYAGDMNVIGACGSCRLPTICSEANARLIAAAPELLEALERCFDIMNNGGTWSLDDQAAARAAIAKAKGEDQHHA